MATKKDETASFVVRFTQKIFNSEDGTPDVQWRGHIRHIQGGEEKRFSDFDDVNTFIQAKLADLTTQAVEDKTPEEQKGIIAKSFDFWRQMAKDTPKIVLDTIKDPKKQVENIQSQISQVGENITQRFEEGIGQIPDIDAFRAASRSDYKNIIEKLTALTVEMERLNEKVDNLTKKSN